MTVDKSVPSEIAADFAEALRCLWVKAYRAAVAMCRRSIEASCNQLGAKGNRLVDKIDDLAQKGKITAPLKDWAHEVRLVGNQGVHEDGLNAITEKDAEDMVAFARQYFEHVYVMPALFQSRRNPQPNVP